MKPAGEESRHVHTYAYIYVCTVYKSRRNGDKENLANGTNGREFDERSKIDYGGRMFDDAAASLPR